MSTTPPDDSDRTVVTRPGAVTAAPEAGGSGNALATGTYLAEFELQSVLGEGGFGIVYKAWDHSLERSVALKEFMPAALAARGGDSQVQVRSARHRETFEAGRRSFINEAKLLAQFDHPSLLKVYRFWEANGTAYMVMPFYEGITLKEQLRRLPEPPDEAWLMGMLDPLTAALSVIHAEHCFHRDIAPDNILLLAGSGRPLLLDFGAARRVIGDMTQDLTVILKPGYAPIEQYAEAPQMKQGDWTDVYALAASIHFAITGKTPPAAVGRLMGDSYEPLAQVAAGRYSPAFLEALDRALAVRPESRTQTMADLRRDLGLAPSSAPMSTTQMPTLIRPREEPPASSLAPAPVAAARSGSSRLPLVLGAAALVGLGAGAYLLLAGKPDAVPAPAPAPAPAQAAAPAQKPPLRFDAVTEFDKLLAGQTPDFGVTAKPAATRLGIGRDRLAFSVSSARAGHVYVMVLGPDGSLSLLFPNSQVSDNRIRAGQTLQLPQNSWLMDTSEPAGAEHFLVLVSAEPRDFSLLSSEREYYFLKLPTGDKASALLNAWTRPTPLLLGGPGNCQGDGCDAYGAARFSVEVLR
ncbi:serine/threonine-protein kinase [Pelomonas sp. SE-A7]|uniref:serine/threonine protein kinase n=1 Tax=Pelomonas sp. SE-A7 TaxID=3054953 RepID=UPI00259CFCE4|nr:serine/threonine-protein kinase [Pelomonas sp. SE-A7]MDM4764728.1 serine/threonine-protein kinase [Pelomonas sp. SE-A7]